MEYLDTNLIIRYLTQDHPEHAARVQPLFQQLAAGTVQLSTCEGVLIEVVHVLASRALYHLPRNEIQQKLSVIIDLAGLKLPFKHVYQRALELYEATPRLDFVDALIVAHMEHARITSLVSFDKDFDGLPTVTRREP